MSRRATHPRPQGLAVQHAQAGRGAAVGKADVSTGNTGTANPATSMMALASHATWCGLDAVVPNALRHVFAHLRDLHKGLGEQRAL